MSHFVEDNRTYAYLSPQNFTVITQFKIHLKTPWTSFNLKFVTTYNATDTDSLYGAAICNLHIQL